MSHCNLRKNPTEGYNICNNQDPNQSRGHHLNSIDYRQEWMFFFILFIFNYTIVNSMPANLVTLTLTTVNDFKNKLTFYTFNTWYMCLSNTCIKFM